MAQSDWVCDGIRSRGTVERYHFIKMRTAGISCKMVFSAISDGCRLLPSNGTQKECSMIDLPLGTDSMLLHKALQMQPFVMSISSQSLHAMQGLACSNIKLTDVLLVDDARTLVKLRNFSTSKVRSSSICSIRIVPRNVNEV